MPITSSAKKALRQNIRRRERNQRQKEALKKIIKRYQKSSASLSQVYRALDKAAKANLIKKNKAARLKSRLARQRR